MNTEYSILMNTEYSILMNTEYSILITRGTFSKYGGI